MIRSTSWGCPGGLEANSNLICQRFKAANIFTLETDFWESGGVSNYWLAEHGKVGEDQGFIVDLGCTKMVSGVKLRNTHNAHKRDRSTKTFRLLGSLNSNGPWQELLNENLEDSRQQNPPPVQQLMFCAPVAIHFIKFELLEFWAPGTGGEGGGLQYLATISSDTTASDSWTLLYSRPEEMPIVKDTLLTSFDTLPNEWKVIFELKPSNLTLNPWDDWLNIFHMTNRAGGEVFGDKNPKITFSSRQGLWICSAVKDNPNYCVMGFKDMLTVGRWTRFEVSQEFVDTKLMYRVVINRAKVFSMENKLTGSVKDVKVYASTAWQGALPGYMKDLSILVKSGQCVVDSTEHRVLPNILLSAPSFDASNSPATCIARCLELGHAYAGVQNSNACHCGDSHPNTITCNSECSMDCPGDSKQKCGSSLRMNVWPTGLEPIPDDTPITGPDADASSEEIEAAFNVISSTQSTAIRAGMNSRECLFPNNAIENEDSNKVEEETAKPPPIDIFINPDRSSELENISSTMMETAKKYFATSDMSRLYPELFRTLWSYTLPCFPEPGIERAMLRSCSVGGLEIPCSDVFKRVPTDSGC